MPYIKKCDRAMLTMREPLDAGELNYLFSCIANQYILGEERMTYQRVNDVIGALEGAKLELYRRLVAPYEDKKIKENGDVYDVL